MPEGLTRQRWVLPVIALATLVAMTPNSLLLPAFPALSEAFGVPFRDVALLITLYTVAYALATPFLGVACDRYGRVRVLSLGLLLFGAGGLVPLATPAFPLVLAGRALMGVGGAAVLTATFALVADLYAEGRPRERAAGVVSLSIAVSESLVPFAGGVLAALSWKAPLLVFALAFPMALLARVALPDARPAQALTLRAYAASAREAVASRRLWSALAVTFVFSGVYFGAILFIPVLAPARVPAGFPGGAPGLAGAGLLVLGTAWALTALGTSRLTRALPARRVVLGGLLAQVLLVPLALQPAPHVLAHFVLLALWGCASGVTFTPLLGLALQGSPASHRGVISSLFNMATLLGLGAGPALFGALAETAATGAAALIAGAALLAGAGAFALLSRPPRRAPARVRPHPRPRMQAQRLRR